MILPLVFLVSLPARAQEVQGIDLNALPLPIADSPFYGLRGGQRQENGQLSVAIRSSALFSPLTLRAPSPAPEGYKTTVVAGSLLFELAFSLGLPQGFDAGLSLGVHPYQWGRGVGPLTGTDDTIASFGVRDPKLELGYGSKVGTLSLRPYVALTIPMGTARAFSGEITAHGELGGALSGESDSFVWGTELGLSIRPATELSATIWASQFRAAGSLLFRITPELSLGPEVHLLPVLHRQPSEAGTRGALLMPAEALLTAGFSAPAWSLRASGGTGIPLSRSSESSGSVWLRGPTSPNLRLGLDLRLSM